MCLCAAIVGGVLFVSRNPDAIEAIRSLLRIDFDIDSGRKSLWEDGIRDFQSFPWFGIGFNDGGLPAEIASKNVYSNMYHNILVEFLGATGIVGCIAFAIHFRELIILFFKRFSINKALLSVLPLMIIAMSLFDNFFFYPHFQIFYAIFLGLAESVYTQSANDKDNKLISIGMEKL